MAALEIDDEPDGDSTAPHHFYIGVAVAAFGFASVWPYYSLTGASMAVIGLLVALDDVIEHTTDLPTPLDQLWKRLIYPVVAKIES
jgi:hypothetical protein